MDERADMIGLSIMAQAEQESKAIIAKANEIRDREINVFEETLIHDMFTRIQKQTSDLRVETTRTISSAQVEARRSLLRRREELAAKVFESVREKLAEYGKTPAYGDAVLAGIKSVADHYNHASSAVYLREADMPLGSGIKAILKGCSVEKDNTIRLGGWKLRNDEAGILIDETLDARLDGQRPWFFLNSGLKVV